MPKPSEIDPEAWTGIQYWKSRRSHLLKDVAERMAWVFLPMMLLIGRSEIFGSERLYWTVQGALLFFVVSTVVRAVAAWLHERKK